MAKRFAYIPALLLVLLCVYSAKLALARLYFYESSDIIGKWYVAQALEMSLELPWDEVHHYLSLATRLSPFDQDVLEDLGFIYQSKQTGESPSDPDDMNQARYFYRQSIALRPAWPNGWLSLAALKLKEKSFDDDLVWAMERAATLGPWEPSILLGIAEEGMYFWDELPIDLQELVTSTVTRGLRGELQSMIYLAEEYGLIEPSAEDEDESAAGSTEH